MSSTDARIVLVRSPVMEMRCARGMDACIAGIWRLTSSTVAMTFAPGTQHTRRLTDSWPLRVVIVELKTQPRSVQRALAVLAFAALRAMRTSSMLSPKLASAAALA